MYFIENERKTSMTIIVLTQFKKPSTKIDSARLMKKKSKKKNKKKEVVTSKSRAEYGTLSYLLSILKYKLK